MKLRAYLILMSAATLIPLIGFFALALNMLEDKGRETALREMDQKARSISLLVERELYSSEAALRILATSPSLKQGDMAGFYTQAQKTNLSPNSWTVLFDENGHQIINTLLPFGTPLSVTRKERIAQVLSSRHTRVSDVVTAPVAKRLITTVTYPVYLDDGRRYVLSMAFNTEHFSELIRGAEVPEGSVVAIIDRQGNFIARSVRSEEMIGKQARPELVAAIKQQSRGVIRHRTWESVEVYDSFTPISLAGWATAIAVPVKQVEAAGIDAAKLAAMGMLIAVSIAAFLAWAFGGKIVRSIRNAGLAAVELGQGGSPHFGQSKILEVDHLYRSLNQAGKTLQQAHKENEAQNKAKDEFLAMLGHELRNPLAPISMAAEVLKLSDQSPEKLHHISDIISRQVDHMKQLVDELLDVSRVTRGLVKLNQQPIAIREVISAAEEQAGPLIDARAHRFAVDMPNEDMWVHADRTRLIQIIVNLLSNAAKYTPPNGKIELEVHPTDETVNMTVRDNGIGMGQDLLPHVFDLFSQGKRANDRSEGGLGLGLALVKHLVQLHGGQVSADSAGPDKGSTFIISLPRMQSVCAEEEPTFSGSLQEKIETKHVLIVDDNRDAADSLAMYLRQACNAVVQVCYSGKEVMQASNLASINMFILDIGLPDLDGYELAQKIRSVRPVKDYILVAITGYGQEQDILKSKKAGFDHHLSKPARPEQLAALFYSASNSSVTAIESNSV